LKKELYPLGRQLAVGNMKSFVAAVMKIDKIKDLLYEQTCEEINSEIQRLCSKSDPSIL
jgi:hypothetical protein